MNDLKLAFDFDLKNFSTSGIDLSQTFQTRYVKPPYTHVIPDECLFYESAEKLAEKIELHRDCRYFVVINGSFIFGDFIEALIVSKEIHIRKMTISTLSMSENNVDSLANLLNGGYVDELNLIVSDYFYSHEKKNLVPYIYKELDKEDRFQLAVAGSHCKMCIFETHRGNKVAIHGSANLRSSANIEQFVIEQNDAIYDFNDTYQDAIIKQYKTINKAIRYDRLKSTIKDSIHNQTTQ